HMETNYRETLQADFDAFDISEELGFILEEPLTHLPDYYRVWMDLANNLAHLIESRKLRDLVHKMPVLSPHLLSNHRELRLAHLALGFICMGYVWQEGQHEPAQILPKALAWPYWLISRRLGLPPILTYADSVLANWKLKDPTGCAVLHFFTVSLKKGHIKKELQKWRDNPMLPRGLLYEGVSNEPILLSGGSAAQSSAIQCFDALLCIQHEGETGAFLTRMRDYMPPAHRQLIETLSVCPSLRDFITTCSSSDLCQAYNSCVSALVDLRSYHLNTVAKYVLVPGNRAISMGCPLRGVGTALNTTGTGGSDLMVFLKSVRNTTQRALILERPTTSRET
uniref:Indoleamine 2,3-dioxygenase 2-like n=1 Tax=Fundulus heteroclitus TaxID=8078 RepID=A0A3Q2R1E6_FUNHE